ncbi:MAG: DnaJ domain-containing protein [bacterium]|nr:DnaJ domain-containing protein [bacterium]
MAGERSNNDNLNAANNDAEKEGDRERIERKRIKNAKNHYEVLGVLKDASDDEITTAFRSLSKKYFPDRNPGDDEAPALFKKVKKAARVLLDPQKRADYDLLQEKKGEVLGKKNLSGNIKITSELKPDTSDWSLEKLQAELSRKEFALDMAREKRESSPENIEKLENEAIELRQRIAKVQGGSGLVSPPPATEPQKRKQVADPVPQPDALTNPVLTLEEQAMDAQISGLKEANREQVQVLEGLENLENENAAGKKAQAEPETEKRGPKIPEMKNLWEALGRMESEVQRQTELARVLKAFKKGERVYGSLKDKMEYYLKLDEITKNKKGNVDKFSELKFKVYRKNGEEIAGKIITKKITEIEYREWKKTKKAPADGDTYVTSEGKPVELVVQEVKENSFW